MTGHLWASRLVAVLCGVLLAASALFAATWSASTPSPAGPDVAAAAARPPQPAPTGQPLFRDDFEDDAVGAGPRGWIVEDGRWDGVVEDGSRVVRHAGGQSYGHLAAGSAEWTDYGVGVRLRPAPLSTGFAGVAARYRDRGDYYACGVYYAGAVRLWRVLGGSTTVLDARRLDVPTDRFHDVRLVARGSQLSCVFDQTVVLTATDASFPSGRIALVAGSDETAEFDDVVVGT